MSGSVRQCEKCGRNTWSGEPCVHCGAPEGGGERWRCIRCGGNTLPSSDYYGPYVHCIHCGRCRDVPRERRSARRCALPHPEPDRTTQVAALLAQGMGTRRIARELGCSTRTVARHLQKARTSHAAA